MATFTNQASLSYNNTVTTSNVTVGELLEVLSATKTAVVNTYGNADRVTYVISIVNAGTTPLTGLTLTDDLGGYTVGTTTVYPLTYEAGSVTMFTNGVPQAAPAVAAGPPLVFSDITVPAGGDVVLVYQAQANEYADPAVGGTIENTVTVTGDGLSTPITAVETVGVTTDPALTISKSITPSQVVDNDRVTYTFVIQNSGNEAVIATDNAAITDTFDPILTALTVTFDGAVWTEGVQYNYDETTGVFTTVPGQILVPAATYTQDPVTGAYSATPGIATLVVTGTI